MHKPISVSLIVAFLLVCIVALSALIFSRTKSSVTPEVSPSPTVSTSSTPLPTEKTYSNSTLGFTVKYPASWFVVVKDDTTINFQSRDGEPVINNDLRGDAQLIILSTTPRVGLRRSDLEDSVSTGGLQKTVISTTGNVVLYVPSKMTATSTAFLAFTAKGKEMMFMTDTAPTDEIANQELQVLKDMAANLTIQ